MSSKQLGRLQPVDLRTVWNNEATDFTPWPEQYAWLKEKLELFYQVFESRVKELDAADYIDSEDEDRSEL